jgi:hypothetical protein
MYNSAKGGDKRPVQIAFLNANHAVRNDLESQTNRSINKENEIPCALDVDVLQGSIDSLSEHLTKEF